MIHFVGLFGTDCLFGPRVLRKGVYVKNRYFSGDTKNDSCLFRHRHWTCALHHSNQRYFNIYELFHTKKKNNVLT